MNPFQRLGLAPTFAIDNHLLQQNYFKAQHMVHPDRYHQATSQEKDFAQQQSEAINAAYQYLKDPVQRAEFLLHQAGLLVQAQTPEVLSMTMEWQEKIAEAFTTISLEKLARDLASTYQQTYQLLEKAFQNDIMGAPALAGKLLYLTKVQQQLMEKKHPS
jgi:molecular chaperone HscB